MSKAIVLYNSRTGNTKQVAMKIAEGLETECKSYKEIPDLKNYDLLVIGSWVAAGNISITGSRMLRKIRRKNIAAKKVAFFFTSGDPEQVYVNEENKEKSIILYNKMFGQMENILNKKKNITILSDRFYAKGATRIFKNSKVIDNFDHPTEEELQQAIKFGINLKKQL